MFLLKDLSMFLSASNINQKGLSLFTCLRFELLSKLPFVYTHKFPENHMSSLNTAEHQRKWTECWRTAKI